MPQYNNKTKYDPGRFRHKITFFNMVSTPNGSGGTTVAAVEILETLAIKEKIREGAEISINAGVSMLNEDSQFVIRKRAAFTPLKNMVLREGNTQYVISGIIPVDEPVNYYRLFCKKQDGSI